jgi:hypothetical protein
MHISFLHTVKVKVPDTFHPKNTILCISSLGKRTEALDNVPNFRTIKLIRAALNGANKNEELMIIKDDIVLM